MSDLYLIRSATFEGDTITFVKNKAGSHIDGVNISWASSDKAIMNPSYNKIGFVKRPLKNTKITLTAELTPIKFANVDGVQKITKNIHIIVPSTDDVAPTEDMLQKEIR